MQVRSSNYEDTRDAEQETVTRPIPRGQPYVRQSERLSLHAQFPPVEAALCFL